MGRKDGRAGGRAVVGGGKAKDHHEGDTMHRTILTAGAIVLLALSIPGRTSAQARIGPYLAYHDDADLGIGGFVTVPLHSLDENLSFAGDMGVFFPDHWGGRTHDVSYWEINADGLYTFPLEEYSFTPWALVGVNIAHWSVGRDAFERPSVEDTELGINLGGGLTFGSGPFRPFAGVKIELDGGRGGVLFGGLSFALANEG